MKREWQKDSLFAGMTANAFKLGTAMTLGWFWTRICGCSVLYRGSSMEQIDFANILAVDKLQASRLSPARYMTHVNDTIYFYVVQRINGCGHKEHTLSAAVKVSINAGGDLARPRPNGISNVAARQTANNKVQLVWHYCPLEQESWPVHFNIYCDEGRGQIDYESPVAVVGYAGRKFYTYQSSELGTGRYLFAIRAEDAAGEKNGSLAKIEVQLNAAGSSAVNITGVKAV
jgi:hypothetical protein